MTPAELVRWWQRTFALSRGGTAVIPATTMTPEETAAAFAEAEREWRERQRERRNDGT